MTHCPLCDELIKPYRMTKRPGKLSATSNPGGNINQFSVAYHIVEAHLQNRLGRCFCKDISDLQHALDHQHAMKFPSHTVSAYELAAHLREVGKEKDRIEHLRYYALGAHR